MNGPRHIPLERRKQWPPAEGESTLHRLVMLSLDGQTAITRRDLTELVNAATGHLLKGMGASLSVG